MAERNKKFTGTGQEAFFNDQVKFYNRNVTIDGENPLDPKLDVNKDGINISTKVKGLNFTGNAVSTVNIGQEQTNVVVEMSTNIDGGEPDSEFGSISRLDGGAI